MKRTAFTALGLSVMLFLACNFSSEQEVTERKEDLETTSSIPMETTSEFEAKALDECIVIVQRINEQKLKKAHEAQRLRENLAKAEKALNKALEKSIAVIKKRAKAS